MSIPIKRHMILVQLLRLVDIEYENVGEVSPATIDQIRAALSEIDLAPAA